AVEAVCAGVDLHPEDALTLVADLASASLLSVRRGVAGEARYWMLEMVREYAAEQLAAAGEQVDVRMRHLAYFAGFAAAASEKLHGRDQVVWLDRLEQDRGNLLAALDWSLDADPARGLEVAANLYWYWRMRGPFGEGLEWLEGLLQAAPDAAPAIRAHAHEGAGRLAVHQANWAAAREHLGVATRMWRELDDPLHLARTLVATAMINEDWLLTGDSRDLREPDPIPALHEAIALGRRASDHVSLSYALLWLAAPTGRTDLDAAYAMLAESLQISREAGDDWVVATGFLQTGHTASGAGDWVRALDSYRRTLHMFRTLKEPWGIAIALAFVARCELATGNIEAARESANESLLVPGALPQPVAFDVLAGVAAATEDLERALVLHGAAIGQPTADPRMTSDLDAQPWIARARKLMDEATLLSTWRRGQEMSRAEAIEFGLGRDGAGEVASSS
ncbi:MAG TPA: hypothetical protein VEW68_00430, partial [Patescibacteria group bacterium]|nr:hypothetical protein [Patescibacteria group bacterium]